VTFASFGLPTPVLKGIRAAGLTEATAIQSRAIPIILQGNDLIGIAESGSGKTGAYMIPTIARLLDRSTRLRGVILVPTRELASYVETRARDYARFVDIRIGVVYTGGPLQTQERMLRDQPVNILVATPGRLLELHARGCLDFADVEILVLDEADRMVALGLAPDLRKLLKLLPETRQTLLFTLTMPPELNRLAKEALVEPVRVDTAPPGKPAAAGITQAIYPVSRDLKPALLDEMLARAEVRNTIVLTRAKTPGDRLARQLQRRGYAVAVLDEHLNQGERERALEDLKRGRVQILVASEAAARSLDVVGTAHIVNYDVPQTPEDYVHHLGRAGRADSVGDAFTLMSPEEEKDVAAIERFLGRAIPRVVLPDFDYDTPHPIRAAAAHEDDERARRAGGLGSAASRIAAVPRGPGANGSRPVARKPAPTPAGGSDRGKTSPASRKPAKPKPRAAAAARGAARKAAPRRTFKVRAGR
jgi:ATP-dependent RNA helicase RhlE